MKGEERMITRCVDMKGAQSKRKPSKACTFIHLHKQSSTSMHKYLKQCTFKHDGKQCGRAFVSVSVAVRGGGGSTWFRLESCDASTPSDFIFTKAPPALDGCFYSDRLTVGVVET